MRLITGQEKKPKREMVHLTKTYDGTYTAASSENCNAGHCYCVGHETGFSPRKNELCIEVELDG